MADSRPSRETAAHYTWDDRCDGWHLLRRPDLGIIVLTMEVEGGAARECKAR